MCLCTESYRIFGANLVKLAGQGREGAMMKIVNWGLPLATVLFYGLLVGWFGPMVDAGGLPPFDLRPLGYDLADAQAFLATLTPAGKAAYLGPVRIVDSVFPVLMMLTFVLAVRRMGWAAMIPAVLYGGLDLAENRAVAGILTSGIAEPEAVHAASLLTQAKFAAFALAALLALWSLIQNRRRKSMTGAS